MSLRLATLCVALALALGCQPDLPDPESAGAQVYQVRCSGCHPAYGPGTLTTAMWEMQIDRMQGEMVRRGVNPLTEQERFLVMSYLRTHSSDGAAGKP